MSTPSPDTSSSGVKPRWNIDAACAAWLIPGMGHFLLGERKRGIVLAGAIGLLWFAGLLIGGVGVVDVRDNRIAFAGQMIVAPSIAVQMLNSYVLPSPPPMSATQNIESRVTGQSPAYGMSFNRVFEHGSLYTALAGMLNLLAIIDVLYRDPSRPRDARPQPTPSPPVPTAQPATGG